MVVRLQAVNLDCSFTSGKARSDPAIQELGNQTSIFLNANSPFDFVRSRGEPDPEDQFVPTKKTQPNRRS